MATFLPLPHPVRIPRLDPQDRSPVLLPGTWPRFTSFYAFTAALATVARLAHRHLGTTGQGHGPFVTVVTRVLILTLS